MIVVTIGFGCHKVKGTDLLVRAVRQERKQRIVRLAEVDDSSTLDLFEYFLTLFTAHRWLVSECRWSNWHTVVYGPEPI